MEQGNLQKPETNLVWAILSTILCCLPLGVVSIVYASKVDSLWSQGLQAEAVESSKKAKKWAMIGAIAGVVGAILYVIFVVIIGVSASSY